MAGGIVASRNRSPRRKSAVMSEINVTPLVDVMLVLLIIFMVSAPLLTVGVEVDLPQAEAKSLSTSEEPLVISIKKDGKIYLQDSAIKEKQLVARLTAITQNNQDLRLYIRGDRTLDYGKVMRVMGMLNTAGFGKIALIAELP